jgi:dihydroorotate dehydrogenase (NAD+) catalytic subunit
LTSIFAGLDFGRFIENRFETSKMSKSPDLKVNLGTIELQNPVITASGTFGYAREFAEIVDLNRLGGIIVKGLSLQPAKGNPPPRIVETPCGMLNAIGLENVGIDAFVSQKLPFLRTLSPPIFANIYGTTIEDYAELAARLDALEGIAGVEVNISCPNVKAGGIAFGSDPDSAFRVVEAVRAQTTKHLIVKLSPNVTDITVIARSAEAGGADSLSLINTITGMAVDLETRRPKLANITGGLSGPAIKPIALRMVWQVVQATKIPVIGIGGIMTPEDALEFLIAGAAAVQVGTANFVKPDATIDIIDGIEMFLAQNKIDRVADIIGTLETKDQQPWE